MKSFATFISDFGDKNDQSCHWKNVIETNTIQILIRWMTYSSGNYNVWINETILVKFLYAFPAHKTFISFNLVLEPLSVNPGKAKTRDRHRACFP